MSIIQPDGPHLIQHLNVIVWQEVEAYAGGPDWPYPDFVYDPSTPGDPSTWPPILYNPDGTPSTVPPYSRTAGGPDGTPRKTRKGGTGNPPAPNFLTRAGAWDGPRQCFAGNLRAQISVSPDPFGYNGTQLALLGALCAPYLLPVISGPTTALVTKTTDDTPLGLSPGTVPIGTLLPDTIAIFLALNVGATAIATVIGDRIEGPNGACTLGGALCAAAVSGSGSNGTGLGTVITAA
jgi:hypothetical protein